MSHGLSAHSLEKIYWEKVEEFEELGIDEANAMERAVEYMFEEFGVREQFL